MRVEHSVFISYSHADRDRVLPIASYLGRLGLRVWMDTKEVAAGHAIVEEVSNAIANTDIYVIAVSPSAMGSRWVNHELNTALTLEISTGRPKVLPIIVAKTEIPVTLRSRLYVDLTGTLDSGKQLLKKAIVTHIPTLQFGGQSPSEGVQTELVLASVILQLHAETERYYGGSYGEAHTKEEVEEEAVEKLRLLRRRANGILLNFIPAAEMNFDAPRPKFPNGEMSESTIDSTGDFIGTFNKTAVVDVEIINPNEDRLGHLVSSKLSSLGVSRAVYTFLVSPPIPGLPQNALQRLQSEYTILGWDNDDGADVELPDDLKLSVACSEERIRVSIETKYKFQFERRAKEFSIRQFVNWLVGADIKQV